jgi:hypothetical protein
MKSKAYSYYQQVNNLIVNFVLNTSQRYFKLQTMYSENICV